MAKSITSTQQATHPIHSSSEPGIPWLGQPGYCSLHKPDQIQVRRASVAWIDTLKRRPCMSGSKRVEVICGLATGVWGLLLLLGAYLQPYGDSRYPEPISLHPGFTPIQYPYLALFGGPLLGIVLGAIIDGWWPSIPARLLLLAATVVFAGEMVISMASMVLS